jgi:hypothetical protein
VSRCGYIIPPNLYPKTHVLKKKIDTPTKNNQLQHIVVKVMGENRGKVTFFPEYVRSPKEVQSFVLMLRYRRGMEAHVHLQAHGERANDRPGGVIVRFLSRFDAFEKISANDRPRRCDRSQKQNVTSHEIN